MARPACTRTSPRARGSPSSARWAGACSASGCSSAARRRSCSRAARELELHPLVALAAEEDLVLAVGVDDAEAGLVLLGPGAVDDLDEVQLEDLRPRVGAGVRPPGGGLEVGP